MTKKYKPLIIVTLTLLIATLACSLGGKKDVPLGETFRSETGGFSLQKFPEYDFEEVWGMVIMMPPDAQEDVGPFIMAYGGLIEENRSTQDILAEMQGQASDIQFSSPRETKVDGKDGLLVEFSGEEQGQELQGKLFVVAPYPQQEFYITALAPEGRWKELEPVFDAVLKSVAFFEAQPFDFGYEDGEWDEPFEELEEVWEAPTEVAPVDSPFLGEVYTHESGLFSVRKIAGYDFADDFGYIVMAKPGITSYAGPLFNITYDNIEGPLTNEEFFAMAMDDPAEVDKNYGVPMPYVVDGLQGLMVDFDGTEGGEAVQGQVFFVMLTPYEYFSVYGIAPVDEWTEGRAIYQAVLASVEFSSEAAVLPEASGEVIRQWAIRAEASSEYTSTDWSAMQATGAPDVPECGDDYRAWASLEPDTEDYLVLHYETPVNPTELVIYQTFNPSQVVEIQLVNTAGETWMVWSGEPEALAQCPDVWTHTITPDESFYTDTVVIWVDQSVLGIGWAEIDAVELVGYPQGVSGMSTIQGAESQPGSAANNYTGLMAGPAYQAWLDIIVGETIESELARIMPIPVEKYDDPWKPNPDHKQTYVVEMPWAGMKGLIAVHNEGWVYKKYFNEVDPTDFFLTTVNLEHYGDFTNPRLYDTNFPYAEVANHFESPGFLRDETYLSGYRSQIYWWYGPNGELVVGLFTDGELATLSELIFYYAP